MFARRLALLLCIGAVASHAAIYEQPVEIEDEDDIMNASQRGDISSETMEILLDVLREGIDLNSASRDEIYDLPGLTYAEVDAIIAYRDSKEGGIGDPAELVAAEAITQEQLLQIAPFLRVDVSKRKIPLAGKVRAVTQFTVRDNVPPPAVLTTKLEGPWNLSGGLLLTTTRRRMSTPVYDQALDTLVSDGFGYHFHLPRAYVKWKPGKVQIIAGTFALGFGERLTLDNSRRRTPRGLYTLSEFQRDPDLTRTCKLSSPNPISSDCVDENANLFITPDFKWRDAFRGVAASVENIQLGTSAQLSLYGFASYQSRSIYQYELYDRRTCSDPNTSEAGCKTPPIYVNEGEFTGSTKLIYSTLPYIYDEITGGAHAEIGNGLRWRVGATGYGALPLFRPSTQPLELDFKPWSSHPGGGPFGAVGVDAMFNTGGFRIGIEGTRTFNQAIGNDAAGNPTGGGGFGVVQRTTYSTKRHEVELSLRFFDRTYSNPYARPPAAPDETDGDRARNELGLRVRYQGKPNRDWQIRSQVDAWVLPYTVPTQGPAGTANLYALVRADFTGWRIFKPGVWVDIRNRNLASSEHGGCASGTIVLTEGDPFVCSGDFYRVGARVGLYPIRKTLSFVVLGYFTLKDDLAYKDQFRQDFSLWAEIRFQPLDVLGFRLRSRYLNESLDTNLRNDDVLQTFAEVVWTPRPGMRFRLRSDLIFWLDQRANTLTRIPNPENRFLLDLSTTF